jgi:hypothetical protein
MKKQRYMLTFAAVGILGFSSHNLSAQMEETITYGTVVYLYDFSSWTYEWTWGEDIFDRDLAYEDWYEEQQEHDEDCNDLLIIKPAQCTTDPGPASNYVDSFFPGWNSSEEALAYQNLFNPGLLAAANHFIANQDSFAATTVFFNEIADSCLNGGGADIDAPTIWPVSNKIYCLYVAGKLAEGMDTNFNVPSDFGFSYIISFPLNLGPWGNTFYEGLATYIQCRAWYNSWNAFQC